MKRCNIFVTTISFFLHYQVQAEVQFFPRLEIGQSAYDLRLTGQIQLPFGQTITPRGSLSAQVYVLRIGGTLGYENIFADMSYQTSTTDSTTQVIPELMLTEQWSAERNDINLTFGYAMTDSVSLFVGYRDLEAKGSGVFDSNYLFQDKGAFVGSSYSYEVTDTATLSASAAYAFLDVDFEQRLAGFSLPLDSGDGDGIKLGIQWSDSLNNAMGYVINADWYDYGYTLSAPTSDVDISLEEVNLRIGLVAFF